MQKASICNFKTGPRLLSIVLLVACLSSCGYRFGTHALCENYQTFFVPYIEGDERGIYTNALIYTLAARTTLTYENCSPDLIVQVCLRQPHDSMIGFTYAKGDESKVVTSNEARLAVIAEVKLIEATTGRIIRHCQRVVASIDFDFQSDFSDFGEDTFSLGQLKMYPQARESCQLGVANQLAEKIVDSLAFCW